MRFTCIGRALSVTLIGLLPGFAQGGTIAGEHVLDGTAAFAIDYNTTLVPGVPIPVQRNFEHFNIGGVTDSGDVMLWGQLDQNVQYGNFDLNYVMFSPAGQHDGRPEAIIHDRSGSPIDGKYINIQNVELFLLPAVSGYAIAPMIDLLPDLPPSEFVDSVRIEMHVNLNSGSPSYAALGSYNTNAGTVSFPFNLDLPSPPLNFILPPSLEAVNRTGDQFVLNMLGVHVIRGTDASATVEHFIAGTTITLDGASYTLPINPSAKFAHTGDLLGLEVRDPATSQFKLLGRNPNTGEFYQLDSNAQGTQPNHHDSTRDGFVSFVAGGQIKVANLNTGVITPVSAATVEGMPGGVLTFETNVGNQSVAPHLDHEGRLVGRGLVRDAVNSTVLAEGLFRFDPASNLVRQLLVPGDAIDGTDFRIDDSYRDFLRYLPHRSGIVALIAHVTNGDESAQGNALLVLDQNDHLIPIILPGDTLELIDGSLFTVGNVDGLNGSMDGVNQQINADGLTAVIVSGSAGSHVFTIQLPIPEPASAMLLAIGGLALLWRRSV